MAAHDTAPPGHDAHGEEHEAQLLEEVQNYLQEKEKVRRVLGRVGGTPGNKEKVANILFLIFVAGVFVVGLFYPEQHIVTLEVAILLVSLKLALVLRQNAKMSHFQFWMLSTIEWRLTQLNQDVADLKKKIEAADETRRSSRT